MRTIRRTEGELTYFIITDVEPVHEEALRGMIFPELEDGFGRSFPSDTADLDRIYHNFERYAVEMVLQAARIHPAPWQKALHAFLQIVEKETIGWWLTGSAALTVRGIDVEPRDLDLVVDDVDAVRLGDLLFDYLVEPVVPVEDWICDWWGRAFIHARVEWVGGVNSTIDQDGVSDAGPTAASRLETVVWQGNVIRVPPLDLQLEVSQRRGLTERVDKIRRGAQQ